MYGKLEQFTEIHVADTAATTKAEVSNDDLKQSSTLSNRLLTAWRKFLPLEMERMDSRSEEDEAARSYELLQSFRSKKKPTIYRVHPMPKVTITEGSIFDAVISSPYHVLVPRSQAPKFTGSFGVCRVKKVPEDRQHVSATSTSFLTKDDSPVPKLATELIVRLFVLEDLLEKSSRLDKGHFDISQIHKTVYVSDSLRVTLDLKTGAKVSLWQVEAPRNDRPSSIELFSWRNSVSKEVFTNYVRTRSTGGGLLLNSCAAVALDNGRLCVVTISPENCTSAVVDGADLENLVIHSRPVNEISHLRLSMRLDQEHHRLGRVSTR